MKTTALPGFRDFYPDDLALRSHIFATWRTVAGRYGFEEYDGPPLEPLDLYTAKSGAEIVGQLYNFKDKGDREVALRPEMTPTLARMVAARANGLRKPIRWFSIPQLFRYERQQRGRLREHFQLNCDLIGEPGPLGDAEIIALAIDVMRAFGLTARDVRVRLSDRNAVNLLLDDAGVTEAQRPAAYEALDKAARQDWDRAQASLAAAGFSAKMVEAVRRMVWRSDANALDLLRNVGPERRSQARLIETRLGDIVSALKAMGLGSFVDIDLTIVRGLAYYTGTVFELFDAGRTLRAICGGGRYDNLLLALGGVDLPALGFGMGDVVLAELLKERGLGPAAIAGLDVFVAAVTADDLPQVLALAHELRDAGLRVEYPLAPAPLRKQLDLAAARRSRYAIVVGPDEWARGEVVLRDLDEKDKAKAQRAIPREAVVAEIAGLASQGAA